MTIPFRSQQPVWLTDWLKKRGVWWMMSEGIDRIAELKRELSIALDRAGMQWELLENDIRVTGPLSELLEFTRDWRSEIEELG